MLTGIRQWKKYLDLVHEAVSQYSECSGEEKHGCYGGVLSSDLQPWRSRGGIQKSDVERARGTLATHYQVINHRLYRNKKCVFVARLDIRNPLPIIV